MSPLEWLGVWFLISLLTSPVIGAFLRWRDESMQLAQEELDDLVRRNSQA